MNEVELELCRGEFRFRSRGPVEWVEEQFKRFATELLGDQPQDELKPRAGDRTTGNHVGLERVQRSMASNGVTSEHLDRVFMQSGETHEFIAAHLPGDSNKDRAINAYILTGLQSLLDGRDGQFGDDQARQICDHYGCYDKNNHSKVLGSLKPNVAGTKNSGWRLTPQGMTKAAQLVKVMAQVHD